MASVFKRGQVWWIKYYVNGHPVQHSLETTEERVALAKKSKVEYERATRGLALPSKTPIAEFLEEFCRFLETIRSTHKSYKNDMSRLRVFFGPICPSLELGDTCNKGKRRRKKRPKVTDRFKNKHVHVRLLEEVSSEMISQFIARRIREDHLAPKSVNHLRTILRRMFAWAIKEKGYTGADGQRRSPVDDVERRTEPASNIRFLDADQIEEQLEALLGQPRICTMVATYIYAGLRREELLWLTRKDVDLTGKMIRVRAKTIGGQFWQPKTRKNRAVPISKTLLKILRAYKPLPRSQWFFPAPHGGRWDTDNFSQTLRKINRENGLPWSCVDFRHTFGSQLAQKGESLYKISELMGNSPEICRRHYAALVPEAMRETVEFPVPGGPDEQSERSRTDLLLTGILKGIHGLERALAEGEARKIRRTG